jgi:nucleotide-binding universal stress UspA family protein
VHDEEETAGEPGGLSPHLEEIDEVIGLVQVVVEASAVEHDAFGGDAPRRSGRLFGRRKLRESVKLRLGELHLEVDEPAGAFDTLFREGTSYHEIVGMAQRGDFDLIIMASLGRSGLVDMLLGSTAERVVRHAPCPVLVVREPRESKPQTT